MEAKEINNAKDMKLFVEACLDDLLNGRITKDGAIERFEAYTIQVINLVEIAIKG